MYVCMYACMYVCMYVMYVMYVCVCVCMYVCLCLWMYVCMYVFMYVMYVCMLGNPHKTQASAHIAFLTCTIGLHNCSATNGKQQQTKWLKRHCSKAATQWKTTGRLDTRPGRDVAQQKKKTTWNIRKKKGKKQSHHWLPSKRNTCAQPTPLYHTISSGVRMSTSQWISNRIQPNSTKHMQSSAGIWKKLAAPGSRCRQVNGY